MNLQERCEALSALGTWLLHSENSDELAFLYQKATADNGWFTPEQCRFAIENMASAYMNTTALLQWAAAYPVASSTQKVGLILAGNIPAVGFHDVLCTFIAGHKAFIKFSDKDKVLIPFLLQKLKALVPASADYFETIERLQGVDKVIATGSDNSSRYFEHYFANIPHIIRANRNSIAILQGDESVEDLRTLGEDIFRYYGLGCRSVSKIYVPRNFNFEFFMEHLDHYSDDLLNNSKYQNNYDYNRSVYLLNGTPHWCNDSLIVLEDTALQSRIATLHYEFYDSIEELIPTIKELLPKIQCIVSKQPLPKQDSDIMPDFIPLGKSQSPSLNDYADGIDTMKFLLS